MGPTGCFRGFTPNLSPVRFAGSEGVNFGVCSWRYLVNYSSGSTLPMKNHRSRTVSGVSISGAYPDENFNFSHLQSSWLWVPGQVQLYGWRPLVGTEFSSQSYLGVSSNLAVRL